MISIIAAVAENNVIGNGLLIPWKIPEDMKIFKRMTIGNTVIMGRLTWLSLKAPLKDRTNIVISKTLKIGHGIVIVESLDQALAEARKIGKEIFIIGGRQLYAEGLKKADRLYLSRVHQSPEGDVFFPDVDWTEWKLMNTEEHSDFAFQEWTRP